MGVHAADLTVEERCRLLGGASTWRTHAIDRLGIPALKLSDGPNGLRGDGIGARRTPGVAVPVGIALGATWDPVLVGEVGDLLGREARRKGTHVLLAPTVNLQRTPIGGRVFECFSEDPELTAALAVAYIRAVQSHDVAVTVKHFAANDTEIDRMTVDVHAGGAVLRELYLRPFEAAVRDAGAWGVMSAYNRLHGDHCASNRWLLTEVLRDDWGFDGVVVSDWFGSHETVPSAHAGLNVPMPGPTTIYGDALLDAVEAGDVDARTVDRLVDDLLLLIERTRARERPAEHVEQTVDDPADRALCRRAASAGVVLVANDGTLPLRASTRIAVIGPNAADTRIMGGGSASLEPLPHRTLLDALLDRCAAVVHEPGVRIDRMPPPMTEATLRTPTGDPGLRVQYRNGGPDGPVVATETARTSVLRFFGSTPAGVDPNRFHVTLTGTFTPASDGPHLFSAVLTGAGHVTVGQEPVLDDPDRTLPRGPLYFGLGSQEQTAVLECRAGEPLDVTVSCAGLGGFSGMRLGVRPPDPADLLDRAVAAATDADVAIVVVGTNDEWETEGEDRSTIALPGDQDELVSRVAGANARTVVVVNAGSPVAMPWIDDVAAVLITYFGGNEMADGIADVLLGDADPGGRLPVTYPRRLEDTPAWSHYAPVDGVQTYGEGHRMGYRGFDADGVDPLFPFGHGLSYGTCSWGTAELATPEIAPWEAAHVAVPVRATGDRPATVVVQGYVTAPGDPVPKRLAAWDKAVVPPGGEHTCHLRFPPEAFRRWDVVAGGWVVRPGRYRLHIASSALDVRHQIDVVLGASSSDH